MHKNATKYDIPNSSIMFSSSVCGLTEREAQHTCH